MKTGATCHTLEGVVRFPVPQPEGWGIGKGPSGDRLYRYVWRPSQAVSVNPCLPAGRRYPIR